MNDEKSSGDKATVVHLKDKELVNQICERVRNAILTWLRERKRFVFWYPPVEVAFSSYQLGRFLEYGRNDKLDFDSVAKILTRHSPMGFQTFQAVWAGGDGQNPQVSISIKDNFE